MKYNLCSHIINLSLFTLFVILVISSTFISTFFILNPNFSNQGNVAGWKSDEPVVIVYPNTEDFDNLVSFTVAPNDQGGYDDTLSLTSFTGHLAVYNSLYIVKNMGDVGVDIRLRLVSLPEKEMYDQIWFILSPHGVPYYAETIYTEEEGATLIEVNNTELFLYDRNVLMDDELIGVLAIGDAALVTIPIQDTYEEGERIYPQPILIRKDSAISWETHSVRLLSGQEAYVTVLVRGEKDMQYSQKRFVIDLQFDVY